MTTEHSRVGGAVSFYVLKLGAGEFNQLCSDSAPFYLLC